MGLGQHHKGSSNNNSWEGGIIWEEDIGFETNMRQDLAPQVHRQSRYPSSQESTKPKTCEIQMHPTNITTIIESDLSLAQGLRSSGRPNIYGLRIPIQSNWNLSLLKSLVTSTSDREVVQFLEFGWPVNWEGEQMNLPLTYANHSGANCHPDTIDSYIAKELQWGTLVGPLCSLPSKLRMAISPMTTRQKKSSIKRRVITDLSWPLGNSVNDGIPKDKYLGQLSKIKYPTVDQLCRRAVRVQAGVKGSIKGYKADMRRAFRQIPLDPRDWTLMGTFWKGAIFLDKVTVMGCRSAPYACQRVTSMIRHLMADMDHIVFNFVDDFMGIERTAKVQQAAETLKRLLRDLGVSEAEDKAVPPCYIIEFLGILFDLWEMVMMIPEDKVNDIIRELQQWLGRSLTTRNQLERLLGKLQFAASCVRPGRVFVARIINTLKGMPREGLQPVESSMRKDVMWWKTYLRAYNGQCMMWLQNWETHLGILETDACLQGMGAVMGQKCWRTKLPEELVLDNSWSIAHYEMLAIIVTLQVWDTHLHGRKVVFKCDNLAVVQIINTGKANDELLQSCLRWLCFVMAKIDCQVKMKHIFGYRNETADCLSRSCLDPEHKRLCDEMIHRRDLEEDSVEPHFMTLNEVW